MRSMRHFAFAAAAAAAFATGAAAAADNVFTLGVGAEYSTGKYGSAESTDILYVPFIGKYETGPWVLKAVVPYLRITGPGNVVGAGADRVVLPGTTAPRRTESGLGDVVTSAFYNVASERNAPFGLDVGAKVKFGTADRDKGLGTGENDFSVQADAYKPLGALTAFGSLGYRWYGDPPGVTLKNVYYGAVGGTYRASADTSVGVAYDFRPKISPNGGSISELTAFLSQRITPEFKVQFYGIAGFATGSPDYGLGVLANVSF